MRRFAFPLAALFAAGVATVAVASPASAAGCSTNTQTDLRMVLTSNDGNPTTATAELLNAGVKVTTPDASSYVAGGFAFPVSSQPLLSDITEMSYSTYRYAESAGGDVVPAYKVEVYLIGTGGYTTLVFEPYQHGTVDTGSWQPWDTYGGGSAKWWSTHALTAVNGDPAHTLETWSDIVAAYPQARVISVEASQGTANTGAVAAFDDLSFGTGAGGCVTYHWAKPTPAAPGGGTGSGGSPSPHQSPTPHPHAGTQQGAQTRTGGQVAAATVPSATPSSSAPGVTDSTSIVVPAYGPADSASIAPVASNVGALPTPNEPHTNWLVDSGLTALAVVLIGGLIAWLIRRGRTAEPGDIDDTAIMPRAQHREGDPS